MSAVFCKEYRQYAFSVAGAVFLAAFIMLVNYYFSVGNLYAQNGDISILCSPVFMISMFLIPILTMRLFAEEKKTRTDQLVFTAPISLASVVMGKFFAGWAFFLCGCATILLDVAILAFFGCFQPLVVLGNLAGLCLAGAAFVAIGLFVSSLTENQILAAVLTYCILFGLWLVDFLQPYLKQPVLLAIVQYLSYREHFSELSMGIFSFSTLSYFVSTTVLFLGLTTFCLEYKRL